jgi:nucleotide-binding universal stress UspA family protein
MGPYRKIVVPTDFSLASEDAVDRARELAELNGGATITLLFVVVAGPFAPVRKDASGEVVVEPPIRATIERELERMRDEHLGGWDGVDTAVTVARNAAMGIVDWATAHDQDLIVMTKRGKSGLATPLIGSTAERVVRHATCPVVTLRSARLAATEGEDGAASPDRKSG